MIRIAIALVSMAAILQPQPETPSSRRTRPASSRPARSIDALRQASGVSDDMEMPTSLRMTIVIYELSAPSEKLKSLDLVGVSRTARSNAEFEKNLAAAGTSRIAYRFDTQIFGDGRPHELTLGANTPLPTGRTGPKGAESIAVTYQNVGAKVSVYAMWNYYSKRDPIASQVECEISAIQQSATKTGPDTFAPIFRKMRTSSEHTSTIGQPFAFAVSDAQTADANNNSITYVVRMAFEKPAE